MNVEDGLKVTYQEGVRDGIALVIDSVKDLLGKMPATHYDLVVNAIGKELALVVYHEEPKNG